MTDHPNLTPEDRALIERIVPKSLRVFFTGVRVAEWTAHLLDAARTEGRESRPSGGAWVLQRNDRPYAVYFDHAEGAAALAGKREEERQWYEANRHIADVRTYWNLFQADQAALSPSVGAETDREARIAQIIMSMMVPAESCQTPEIRERAIATARRLLTMTTREASLVPSQGTGEPLAWCVRTANRDGSWGSWWIATEQPSADAYADTFGVEIIPLAPVRHGKAELAPDVVRLAKVALEIEDALFQDEYGQWLVGGDDADGLALKLAEANEPFAAHFQFDATPATGGADA